MQMKHFIAGAAVLCTSLGAAETDSITTRNGKTYANAVIQRADPDGVVIEYAPQPGGVGIAKLKFANLPDDLRNRYNYNEAAAVTFEQNQTAGIARRQEEIAQGEIEKKRRYDELVQQRREEAALEAKMQEAAAMAAAQMQMGGWYGGYFDEPWFTIGDRRFRFDSHNPDKFRRHDRHDPNTFNTFNGGVSTGVGLSDLGQGWGDTGHWGPHVSPAPSQSGAIRHAAAKGNSPARGNPSGGNSRSR